MVPDGPARSATDRDGRELLVLRPTRAQVDAGILDAAAAAFATHGLDGASLQRVADAVGYSKTGLLHRFGSREALLDAVVDRCLTMLAGVVERSRDQPAGLGRDTAVVEALVAMAADSPGTIRLLYALSGPVAETDAGRRLAAAPDLLAGAFGPDPARSALERRVRVLGALGSIATLTVALPDEPAAGLRPLLARVALDTLGHRAAEPGPAGLRGHATPAPARTPTGRTAS